MAKFLGQTTYVDALNSTATLATTSGTTPLVSVSYTSTPTAASSEQTYAISGVMTSTAAYSYSASSLPLVGVFGNVIYSASAGGAVGGFAGVYGLATVSSGAPAITGTISGVIGSATNAASTAMTWASAVTAGSITNTGAGSITSASGVLVNALSVASTTANYGLYINNITGSAGSNYSIYTGTGIVKHADTTVSTTTSTGSLIVSGGVGIGGALFVGGGVTSVAASSVPFLSSTRSDLVSTLTFTQTSSTNITLNSQFTATQFNGSGNGLSLGTVADTYTINNLGTVTVGQSPAISSGRYVKLTLGASISMLLPDGGSSTATEKYIFEITQDTTGSRTIYWQAKRRFVSNLTPTLTTTPNATDIVEFTWNGSSWMMTNFNSNLIFANTTTTALRPTSAVTTGYLNTLTNLANAYDTGTSQTIDSSTYGTMWYTSAAGGTYITYTGFSGSSKSGTLYVHSSGDTYNGGGNYSTDSMIVSYSTNGGSSWTTLATYTFTTWNNIDTAALTSVTPSSLQVRFTFAYNRGGDSEYCNIYDIVFI